MRRNWILASFLGLASTMMLTTAHVSADTIQNDGGEKPENANENTLDVSQQTTSQDVYSDNKTVTNLGIPGVPVTDNTITVDDLKDVDLNNYWKQSADVSEATSAGGHTNWQINNSGSSTAKVTNFKFTTFNENQEYNYDQAQRIGYQIGFDADVKNLQPGKRIHLFRLTVTSDTGYLPSIRWDNGDTPALWHGKRLGIIHSEFHRVDRNGHTFNDYVDYDLIPEMSVGGFGKERVDLNVTWNNILNYASPNTWWGNKASINHVTVIVTNDSFKIEVPITYVPYDDHADQMLMKNGMWTMGYPWSYLGFTSSMYPKGQDDFYMNSSISLPMLTTKESQQAFVDSGFTTANFDISARLKAGYTLKTTNGNRLVANYHVGDTGPMYMVSMGYPLVLPDGTLSSLSEGIDDWGHGSSSGGTWKLFDPNMSLEELKALNYEGLAVSMQDNGSINAYENFPFTKFRRTDSKEIRIELAKQLIIGSSSLNNSKYTSDPLAMKQIAVNTVNYLYDGPTKGQPWSFLQSMSFGYALVDLSEPTTVIAKTYDGNNLTKLVQTESVGYQPDQASLSGWSAITLHYIDGQNGGQIGKIQTTIGDPGKSANISINVPTGYHVRQQNDGKSIILGNGKTFDLPNGAGMYNGGQMLDFGPSNSTIDYYVVLDHNELMDTITFVDRDGKQVGDPVTVRGLSDSDQDIQLAIPDGYLAYAGQGSPLRLHFSDHSENHQVLLKHRLVLITSDQGAEAGSLVPNTKVCHFAKGLSKSDLNKTVTRTIKVMDAGGRADDIVTQTAHFYRNALYDVVTGKVTYLPWSFGGQYMLPTYLPKARSGYQIDNVKEITVTPDSQDSIISVVYRELPSQITVKYMDHTGKVIKTAYPKISNHQVAFDADVPSGYRLATNVNSVKKLDRLSQEYDALVTPIQRTVMPYERDLAVTEPLVKLVTRTIEITLANGHQRVIRQQVQFERRAVIDNTGKVTYTVWQVIGRDRFNKLYVPKRKGYKLVITGGGLDRVDHVEASDGNQVVTVKYVRI